MNRRFKDGLVCKHLPGFEPGIAALQAAALPLSYRGMKENIWFVVMGTSNNRIL